MASVMKFQILSFGENSEAKLVEAEVFAAPPEGRASAAGVAAASPPHAGCADKTTPPGFLNHHRGGEQCPVTELMFLSNSTVPTGPAPSLTSPLTENGRDESECSGSGTGGDFSAT